MTPAPSQSESPLPTDVRQTGDSRQVDEVRRLAQATPEIDQKIGAAGHEARRRGAGLEPHRLIEGSWTVIAKIRQEVHDPTPPLASSNSATRSGVSGRA